MKPLFLFITILLLFSCNSSNNTRNETVDDTLALVENQINAEAIEVDEEPLSVDAIMLKELKRLFIPVTVFPIKMDSLFVNDIDPEGYNALNGAQVGILATNQKTLPFYSYFNGLVKNFIVIDSVTQANKYDEYIDSITPGEIEDSKAYALNSFSIGNINCYTWILTHATGDVCPFSTDINRILLRKTCLCACI
jgi:hypothetical protein